MLKESFVFQTNLLWYAFRFFSEDVLDFLADKVKLLGLKHSFRQNLKKASFYNLATALDGVFAASAPSVQGIRNSQSGFHLPFRLSHHRGCIRASRLVWYWGEKRIYFSVSFQSLSCPLEKQRLSLSNAFALSPKSRRQ